MAKTKEYTAADPADLKKLKELRDKDKPLKAAWMKEREAAVAAAAKQRVLNAQRQKAADEFNAFRESLLAKGVNPKALTKALSD